MNTIRARMNSHRVTATHLVLVSLLLTGCGGGGGSTSTPFAQSQPNDGSGLPTPGSGAPFTGKLFAGRVQDNRLWTLDLETGRYNPIPTSPDLTSLGILRDETNLVFTRDRSVPSGALMTVEDCLEERAYTVCFVFIDSRGNTSDIFAMDGNSNYPGKVSFDGSHVAVNRADREGGSSVMTIFTREGKFVSDHAQVGYTARSGPYDWLPDGRLVYSIEGNALLGQPEPTGIIITDPFDTTPKRRITLPDRYQEGQIQNIETSPDGTQLLMLVKPRVGARINILLNLDTLIVEQMRGRDGTLVGGGWATWGQDGRWVYGSSNQRRVLQGPALDSSQGPTIAFVGSFRSLVAMEVDSSANRLPDAPAARAESTVFMPTEDISQQGNDLRTGRFKGWLVWLPF